MDFLNDLIGNLNSFNDNSIPHWALYVNYILTEIKKVIEDVKTVIRL